jgi:TRAP-type C4-dicarboxylate transport system substrate-binding protein
MKKDNLTFIKLKCYLILLFVITSILNSNETYCAEKSFMIKFATVAPEGSIWVNHMRELDKRIRSKSHDKIGLRIYAGGIAGDELDVLKKIRIGQIHCAAFSGVGITEILPMWRIMDLPFLFRNINEVSAVHRELEPLFKEEFRKRGFEYITWAEVGDVYLFSKKEIKNIDDFKGLKIWTWSGDPVSRKTFALMGSIPISLSITDVTTAINTNMIDTVYAPPVGALSMQWNERMSQMTSFPIAHSTGAILIYKEYFDNIPKELAKLLNDEVKISMNELSSALIQQTVESIKIINQKGVKLSPKPNAQELTGFSKIHNVIADSLKGEIFPESLLIKVNNILDKKRLSN